MHSCKINLLVRVHQLDRRANVKSVAIRFMEFLPHSNWAGSLRFCSLFWFKT